MPNKIVINCTTHESKIVALDTAAIAQLAADNLEGLRINTDLKKQVEHEMAIQAKLREMAEAELAKEQP